MAKPAPPKPAPSKPAPPKPAPAPTPLVRPKGHGAGLRGLDAVARQPEGFGRFGRMFPELPAARYGATLDADKAIMARVGETMIKRGDRGAAITEVELEDENSTIPAGYTYFGQFIDHDITLDVSSSLDRDNDPGALEDFRTARLDLDSVYGRGPLDQPYLYNSDLTLKLGPDRSPPGLRAQDIQRFDVPRAPQDLSGQPLHGVPECPRALLGDKRNDENTIVLQIHALLMMVHNRFMAIARHAQPTANDDALFRVAQRRTRWTYQYLVIHDFLRRIVGDTTFQEVWNNGQPDLRFYRPGEARYPYMPVEFTVAAYRLGHSMVRPSYALNASVFGTLNTGSGVGNRLPIFGARAAGGAECLQRDNLNGFRPLPDMWGIDWSFYVTLGPSSDPRAPVAGRNGKTNADVFQLPQPSYRLDTLLVDPLENLPDHLLPPHSLPTLNLFRSVALGLPSGQSVARAMGMVPLSDDQLWVAQGNLPTDDIPGPGQSAPVNLAAARKALLDDPKTNLAGNAPLWFYILREAELLGKASVPGDALGGHHLGPLGGRIVAEVLIGLLTSDRHSYLNLHRRWTPSACDGTPKADFTLADLVRFVDTPPVTAPEPA
jgi:Animal haem peroxidase